LPAGDVDFDLWRVADVTPSVSDDVVKVFTVLIRLQYRLTKTINNNAVVMIILLAADFIKLPSMKLS